MFNVHCTSFEYAGEQMGFMRFASFTVKRDESYLSLKLNVFFPIYVSARIIDLHKKNSFNANLEVKSNLLSQKKADRVNIILNDAP